MNYTFKMGSGAMIYEPSFVKTLPLSSSRINVSNKVRVNVWRTSLFDSDMIATVPFPYSTENAPDILALWRGRRDVPAASPRGAGPQGAASHLRVQTHQYYGFLGAGCQPLPLPVHHRVLSDLRCHSVRHVEKHLPNVDSAGRIWVTCGSPGSSSAGGLQAAPSPLLSGLRPRT